MMTTGIDGYWIALRVVASSGKYEELNDGYRTGIYTSRSGRRYTEWTQTTSNDIGQQPMFTPGMVMGNYGCNVYACAALVSSTGIEPHIWEVYNTYKSCGNDASRQTVQTLLNEYDVEGKVLSVKNYDHFVSILSDGRGVATWVGSGYNNLYTTLFHWIVVADIRETQLGSEMGYDIYAITSGASGRGHGWQKIETVAKNLQGSWGTGYYIED